MSTITLPWPAAALSPNARVHYMVKARAAKKAKATAWALAKEAGLLAPPEGPIRLVVTFRPPNAARRDLDNMIASIKPHLDGLAEAMRVDDARFMPTFATGDTVKGGSVVVRLFPGAPNSTDQENGHGL